MLFGPDRVISCPACGALERVFTLRTANNLWDSHWTDGYVHRPHFWQPPTITQCHSCRAFYWLEEAAFVGLMPDAPGLRMTQWLEDGPKRPPAPEPAPAAWQHAPHATGYGLDLLYEMIAAGAATTTERELTLRTFAFWGSSHRNRNPRRKKERQKTPTDRRNMLALLDLSRRRFEAGGSKPAGPRRTRWSAPRSSGSSGISRPR